MADHRVSGCDGVLMGSVLDDKVRRSRGTWRDCIDLAEIQGWRLQIKGDGFLFYPPKNVVRPGFECIHAEDPGGDSGKQRHLIQNLRKAGLKFPEDDQPTRIQPVTTPPKFQLVQPPVDATNPFSVIRQKITATINLLSEMEQELNALETDTAKMRQFKELLKSLG